MKIIIVNSFDTFEYRVLLLKKVMKELGHEVMVIGSDFRHIEKTRRTTEDPDITLLPVRAYQKNISVDRILSHIGFAQAAFKMISEMPCDLLYLVVPPNSQAGIAKKYRKKYPNAKVIMDIIDLWPESFPSRHTEQFPFTLWGALRNKHLQDADLVLTECNLYQEKLARFLQGQKVETLYWAREEETGIRKRTVPEDRWVLGYLGSVNHIIDLEAIEKTIRFLATDKPVELQIVGGGESLEELIQTAEQAGATVISHGKIYEAQKKRDIFAGCHYGINMMKNTVVVGLSMKSIEYMEMGLPLLNNLQGDTRAFVEKCKMGYNTDALELTYEEEFGRNARRFYEENCSYPAFREKLVQILDRIL